MSKDYFRFVSDKPLHPIRWKLRELGKNRGHMVRTEDNGKNRGHMVRTEDNGKNRGQW